MSRGELDGRKLLAELDAWSERTGWPIAVLRMRAGIDRNTIRGLTFRSPMQRTADKLRKEMRADWAKSPPPTLSKNFGSVITHGLDTGFRGPVPAGQLVDREPCGWCGVRRDVGCRHYPKQVAA